MKRRLMEPSGGRRACEGDASQRPKRREEVDCSTTHHSALVASDASIQTLGLEHQSGDDSVESARRAEEVLGTEDGARREG